MTKLMLIRVLFAILVAALAACAQLPSDQGRIRLWRPSPNFDQRRPNYVILHQTTNKTVEKALGTLTDPQRKVSVHYLIGRNGEIIQLVDETARAWHAGKSWWGGLTDLNSASIGIELDNTGEEEFMEAQIAALLSLLEELRARYGIPSANYLGHGDIAPGRKVDPGRRFPWKRLASHGFGLWCDEPQPAVPPGFDAILGLQALGYDIADPAAAQQAFRRHFMGAETDVDLSPGEQSMLNCLLRQKASRR